MHVKAQDAPRLSLRGRTATKLLEGAGFGVTFSVRLVDVPPEDSDDPRPQHRHDGAAEFIWVLRGRGVFHGAREQLDVAAGEGVYVPAGERHKITPADDRHLELLCVFSTGDVASHTTE